MNPQPKIKLSAEEMMVMLGAQEPKLSDKVKGFLDQELAKPQYKGLPSKKAWGLACRYLVLNQPEAFDQNNVNDRVMQKVLPLMISEDGERLPAQQLLSRLDMENIALTHEVRGKELLLAITARDEEGAQTARYKARLKPGSKLPRFGLHTTRGRNS